MSNRQRPLCIGDVFHGFARGAFGRDHYDCTAVEAVGPDWIVCRDANGTLSFAEGRRSLSFLMDVRDGEKCPNEDGCPLEEEQPLTGYSGPIGHGG